MIGKEYIIVYILMLILNILYLRDKRKQIKKDNSNPMNYLRLFQSYASLILISILLLLSIFS